MCYAAEVSRLAGRLDDATARRHAGVLAAVGLPTTYAADARPRLRAVDVWPRLRAAMDLDKKTRGGRLRLVVLDGLASPAILDDPPEELLTRAFIGVC
jgi:3-dehydroquinate synthase